MADSSSPFEARTGNGLTCNPCLHTVTAPGGLHPTVEALFRARHTEKTCDVREVDR